MVIKTVKTIRLTGSEEGVLRQATHIVDNLREEYDCYSNVKAERLNNIYTDLLYLINDIAEGDFDMEVNENE